VEELRRVLNHPRLIHWSRDRGQSRIMAALGLAAPERIIHVTPPALAPFLGHTAPRDAGGVGFVGHVYQTQAPSRGERLDELARDAAAAWRNRSTPSLWDAFAGRIDALPAEARSRLRVSRDETFFWSFAHRFIVHEAQNASRLAALGSAGATVFCTGNLDSDAPGVPANLIAASSRVGFRSGLPDALTRHAITLDVLNPGYIEGYSHKPVLGFAAGGFVLVNRTRGFVENFGDAGAAATWTSHTDLAAKVDRYLSRPALRREIAAAIRAEIKRTHTLPHVLRRVLDAAWALRGSPPRPAASRTVQPPTAERDVMPRWHTYEHWLGATLTRRADDIVLRCSGPAGAYAAELRFAASETTDATLRLGLCVEVGRIAVIAVTAVHHDVLYEVAVSTSAPEVTTVEIPLTGGGELSVILSNAGDPPGRVVLRSAQLLKDQN
jgi:hypothetical protein